MRRYDPDIPVLPYYDWLPDRDLFRWKHLAHTVFMYGIVEPVLLSGWALTHYPHLAPLLTQNDDSSLPSKYVGMDILCTTLTVLWP